MKCECDELRDKIRNMTATFRNDCNDALDELATLRARLAEVEGERDKLKAQKRRFPIMNGPSVPWSVMEPHEAQCQKNHSQSLERIAQRGGFDCAEAWFVVNDQPFPIGNREVWIDAGQKWKLFADQINLRESDLTQTRAALAEMTERAKRLGEAVIQCHTFGRLGYTCDCPACTIAREVVK